MSLFDSIADKPIFINVYPDNKLGGPHLNKYDADYFMLCNIVKPLYRLVIRKKQK
jgi:hypothetical protein